jgi:hypothetical protein
MRLRSRSWLPLLIVVACNRQATKTDPLPAASASASASKAGAAVLGAFDLTSTESGAALVTVDATRAGLLLTRFDAAGKAQPIEPLFDAKASDAPRGVTEINELAAASLGEDLDVVWVEKSAQGAHARGLLRPIAARGSAPLQDLNALQEPIAAPRGNVAIGSSDGHFLVLSRREKTACADSNQSDCIGFDLFRQEANGTARTGSPLAVPLPCEQNSVSFAVSGSRWYYGVCSRSTGKPLTTLFSIQSEPAYARADRILEGCLPLGATALGGDLIVIGDCGGQRQGLRVRGGNAALEEVRVDRLEVVCDSGKPLIRQLGAGGLNLALNERRDRLEAFLSPALSPPHARAVWTGSTLLIATPSASGSVSVKRYRCDSTLLREAAP